MLVHHSMWYEDSDDGFIVPLKPLFARTRAPALNDVDIYNDNYIETSSEGLYAVTVNVQPTKLMNKKPWRSYSADKQRAQLSRIEAKFRRDTPSCKLVELHFEQCPVLGNQHFHALYQMPEEFVSTMQNYYRKLLDSTNDKTKIPWRYLDMQPCYDRERWIEYIRKDITKL